MSGLWLAAYRPMFLLAGIWAALVPAIWLRPDLLPDPVFWHLHELMFGMAGAALGGYLLTALPNWTGDKPGPLALRGLVLAWLAGRGAALALNAPGILAAALYPMLLAGLLLPPILRDRVWRKLPLALVPVGLCLVDLAVLTARSGAEGLPPRVPMALTLGFALLIGLVGGRVVPAFTQSWLAQTGAQPGVGSPGWSGAVAGLLVASGLFLSLADQDAVAGGGLMLAGAVQIGRLLTWHPWAAWRSGALVFLHGAWLWLGAGLFLSGLALRWPEMLPAGAALHGLTMGAMGSMILAIASRAVMRRGDGGLVPTPLLCLAFAAVWLSAALRILAGWQAGLLPVAAGLWMVGWLTFTLLLWRACKNPVPHPVLSAPRRGASGRVAQDLAGRGQADTGG